MSVTSLDQLDLTQTYSYADYLQWRLDEMVELVRGKILRMSPAPNRKHQKISMNLTREFILNRQGRHHKCELFAAPFDVRLYDPRQSIRANDAIFTVVQPDLCVICDPEKLDEQGCKGAPDLVIEILSKGNAKREIRTKYDLYQEAGVQEYWVVFPYEQVLQQFVPDAAGVYQLKGSFAEDERFRAHIFPDLEISLEAVFAD